MVSQMKTNYKGILLYITLAAVLVLLLAVIIPPAHAIVPDAYVTTPTPLPELINYTSPLNYNGATTNYTVHYLYQGDVVYLGDHLDLSGALGGNPKIAWFPSGDPSIDGIPQVIDLPQTKRGWYDFYLDPAVFSGRYGWWYKWNGYYEPNGNTNAFYLKAAYRNETQTNPNGTYTNVSHLLNGTYPIDGRVNIPTEILPVKHVSDYLISRGDTLNITTGTESAVWIFNGADNSIIYSHGNANDIIVDKGIIDHLLPGQYNILVQTLGNNSTNLDIRYAGNNTIKWFDRELFVVHEIDLTGMTPDSAISYLAAIFPGTYDEYKEYTLEIQRPDISIVQMDQVSVGSAKEYYHDINLRGNVSLMDVRGYTNVLPGSLISVTLDEATTNPREVLKATYNTAAQGTFLGDSRYFRVYVPLYWDSLSVGMHTITARTPLGGVVYADFPVTIMPADSFQPNISVKWVGDENPWKPNLTTPTPIIKVVTVVQTVTIPVTPSNDQVKAQQEIVIQEKNDGIIRAVVTGVVVIIAGFVGVRFVYRAWKRRRWMQK